MQSKAKIITLEQIKFVKKYDRGRKEEKEMFVR